MEEIQALNSGKCFYKNKVSRKSNQNLDNEEDKRYQEAINKSLNEFQILQESVNKNSIEEAKASL